MLAFRGVYPLLRPLLKFPSKKARSLIDPFTDPIPTSNKFGRIKRGHDKPRLMGVEPSILSRWYIRMPIKLSRWCFQIKYVCIFTRKIGEDEPFWTSIFFQRGWNHQLELEYVPVGEFTKHQIQDNGNQPLLLVQEEKQNPDRKKNLSNPAPPKETLCKYTDFATFPIQPCPSNKKKN